MTKLLALRFASPNPVLALTPSLPRTLTLLLALTLTLPLTLPLHLTETFGVGTGTGAEALPLERCVSDYRPRRASSNLILILFLTLTLASTAPHRATPLACRGALVVAARDPNPISNPIANQAR